MSTRSVPFLELSVMAGLLVAGLLFGYLVIGQAGTPEEGSGTAGGASPSSEQAPKSAP